MFLSKRNNGIWYYYFNTETGRRSISTGATLKADAVKFVRNFKEKKTTPEKIYLQDFALEALKYAENNLSNSSYRLYQFSLNHLISFIGNKELTRITNKDIENFKEYSITKRRKTSINIYIRTLKAIFNLGVKWNMLDASPMKGIKQFKLPEQEPLAFSNEEISTLLAVISDESVKSIVLFGLFTGCRLNEILNVQWSDVNMREKIITIRNKWDFRTKSGKMRCIPISDKCLALLAGLDNSGDLLFNRNGEKFNLMFISHKFKKYVRLAGLPEKYHFHCLRHTFVSNLIKNNININYVKELAGHSDIKTTLNYVHIGVEDLRNAVNCL